MTIAFVAIALIAPVLGRNTDRTGRTMSTLRVLTWAVALINAALFLIADEPAYLWAGFVMLGLGTVVSEAAGSVYNGVLDRISSLGRGMGYLGGVVALMVIYVGFIAPDVGLFGVTAEHGMAVRTAMLLCGAWTFVFTIPTFLVLGDDPTPRGSRLGVLDSYRALLATIARLWAPRPPHRLVPAGLGPVPRRPDGHLRPRRCTGPKHLRFQRRAGRGLRRGGECHRRCRHDPLRPPRRPGRAQGGHRRLARHARRADHHGVRLAPGGGTVLWVLGLALCVFVGPAQAASRSYLARIIPPGSSGEIFGLHATTGRVVSPLAPLMFCLCVGLGARLIGAENTQYFDIIGIAVVLAAGLLVLLAKVPKVTAGAARD